MIKITVPNKDEILKRMKERMKSDVLGFEWHEYVQYLDYEHVKEYLKDNVTKEDFETEELKRDVIVNGIKYYMKFAWTKANDGRGISANRSISHFIAWTWLAGDTDFSSKIEKKFDEEYRNYGKDILIMICDYYKIDYDEYV